MGTVLHLTRAQVPAVIRNACPDYHGPNWKVRVTESVSLTDTIPDGGTWSKYAAVNLSTGKVSPPNPRAIGNPREPTVDLPVGVAVVEHAHFCGKDTGCTIHLRPENAAPLLPSGPSATPAQRAVLEATAAYKSSYGGDKEYRRHQTSLSREEWEQAKAECQAAGWLNAAGAITTAGRNIRSAPGGKRRHVGAKVRTHKATKRRAVGAKRRPSQLGRLVAEINRLTR